MSKKLLKYRKKAENSESIPQNCQLGTEQKNVEVESKKLAKNGA